MRFRSMKNKVLGKGFWPSWMGSGEQAKHQLLLSVNHYRGVLQTEKYQNESEHALLKRLALGQWCLENSNGIGRTKKIGFQKFADQHGGDLQSEKLAS